MRCRTQLLFWLLCSVLYACGDDVAVSRDAGSNASLPDAGRDAGLTLDASAPSAMDAATRDTGTNDDDDDAGDPLAIDGPKLLSQTGLYADIANDELAPGVREYEPRFQLWSDGASKRRWLYLPKGTSIDSSDMDFWQWPVGTKLWKEFSRDGVRVETRLLEKRNKSEWFMIAYIWNAKGSDAEASKWGEQNARGTEHDVPGTNMCESCHNAVPGRVLGASAIQLAHDGPGLTLADLVKEKRLSDAPPALAKLALPGNALQQRVLGYLHANCGHCHNRTSGVYGQVDMELLLRVDSLGSVDDTPTYRSAVHAATQHINSHFPFRVSPGHAEDSELVSRIEIRQPLVQMPPIATELVDDEAVDDIRAWIKALPKQP